MGNQSSSSSIAATKTNSMLCDVAWQHQRVEKEDARTSGGGARSEQDGSDGRVGGEGGHGRAALYPRTPADDGGGPYPPRSQHIARSVHDLICSLPSCVAVVEIGLQSTIIDTWRRVATDGGCRLESECHRHSLL